MTASSLIFYLISSILILQNVPSGKKNYILKCILCTTYINGFITVKFRIILETLLFYLRLFVLTVIIDVKIYYEICHILCYPM